MDQFSGTLLPASMEEEVANLTVTSVSGTEDHYAHVFSDRPSLVLAAVCWSCVQVKNL